MDLASVTLACETQNVVELRDIASLEVVTQDDLISLQIVHRKAIEFHEFSRVSCLLVAIERDRLKELCAVYSELSWLCRSAKGDGNTLPHEGVAN